jgi:hypothetical protein
MERMERWRMEDGEGAASDWWGGLVGPILLIPPCFRPGVRARVDLRDSFSSRRSSSSHVSEAIWCRVPAAAFKWPVGRRDGLVWPGTWQASVVGVRPF